jgi:hypothetical protein
LQGAAVLEYGVIAAITIVAGVAAAAIGTSPGREMHRLTTYPNKQQYVMCNYFVEICPSRG